MKSKPGATKSKPEATISKSNATKSKSRATKRKLGFLRPIEASQWVIADSGITALRHYGITGITVTVHSIDRVRARALSR
jgi:hypothetical protein